MIKFEVGFDPSNLQRLAEFPFEDRLDADRIARFDEDSDGLDWQQSPHTRYLLR